MIMFYTQAMIIIIVYVTVARSLASDGKIHFKCYQGMKENLRNLVRKHSVINSRNMEFKAIISPFGLYLLGVFSPDGLFKSFNFK